MRIALYRRAYTEPGMAAQQAYIQDCLNRHPDWEVVAKYDDIGANAAPREGPGLKRLLADAETKQFDVVLSQSTRRLAQDSAHLIKLFNTFHRSGVEMAFANSIDFEYLPDKQSADVRRAAKVQSRGEAR